MQFVYKVYEGQPSIVDAIKNGEIDFIINTTADVRSAQDSYTIRRSALVNRVPYTTTVSGAFAMLSAMQNNPYTTVRSLQNIASS